MNNKNLTVGQIIRRIHQGEIESIYALCGNEVFLQDFFINVLKKYFLEGNGDSIIYSIGDDNEEMFLSELSAISLFDEKKLIIVRRVQKLSKIARKELIDYIISPNKDLCLILISDIYDPKKAIQKYLESNFITIDVRVPFNNKIKEWVNFIIKQRNYKIESGTIDNLLSIYGDSISHMINEVDKLALMGDKKDFIELNTVDSIDTNREFPIWKLQDSLGNRDVKQSLLVSHSLINNGISITQIIINVTNLFLQLLWIEMGKNNIKGYTYTGLNKIITNNLKKYSRLFSINEIHNILLTLKKTDIIIKTTSIDSLILTDLLVYSVCGNFNE